jgi:hypothetical protein
MRTGIDQVAQCENFAVEQLGGADFFKLVEDA